MTLLLVALIGFIWGAALNWWSGRLLADALPLKSTHFCAQCKKLVRFRATGLFLLNLLKSGKCHACSTSLLWRFPLFEIGGASLSVLTWSIISTMPAATPYHVVAQVIVYGLLMSGLFVATRTDFQAMVIPQVVLVGLVPVALIASGMGVLTISFTTSICGGALGYGSLWSLGKLCKLILKKEGLGVGDMELLGVLGLFTGPIGVWAIMLMSSLFGVLGALVYLLATGQGRNTRVPFGPFLAVATVVYLYAPAWFAQFLVG